MGIGTVVDTGGYICASCGTWTPNNQVHICNVTSDPGYWGGVATTVFGHNHRCVYDGLTPMQELIYHCDEHDPPVVRVVTR